MSTNRFALSALAGGVVVFVAGFLLWGVATASFFEANLGSATGAMKETPDMFHLGLGQLMFGVFLTVVIGKWARVEGAGAGLKVGVVLGLLMGFAFDLTMFGLTNLSNITATLVDPFLVAIQMGLGGAAVGAVLKMTK